MAVDSSVSVLSGTHSIRFKLTLVWISIIRHSKIVQYNITLIPFWTLHVKKMSADIDNIFLDCIMVKVVYQLPFGHQSSIA